LSPSLLIADEPVTALDVTIQAQILDLLKQLRDTTDAAVLLITHDMGVVAETCDRVVVMYLGAIVEEAPVTELFDDPKHPYTQGLLGSIPSIEEKVEWLQAIPGTIPNPTDIPAGCRFSNRCPKVMDVCHQLDPALLTVGKEHRVACHLYEAQETRDG
jgi:peptide/nickel transport system ATP-binding protein